MVNLAALMVHLYMYTKILSGILNNRMSNSYVDVGSCVAVTINRKMTTFVTVTDNMK